MHFSPYGENKKNQFSNLTKNVLYFKIRTTSTKPPTMRSLSSNNANTITLPRIGSGRHVGGVGVNNGTMEEVAGAQDTIYLCNFRVSVDGEWLCLKELQDLDIQEGGNNRNSNESGTITNYGSTSDKCEEKNDRDWVHYCRCLFYFVCLVLKH